MGRGEVSASSQAQVGTHAPARLYAEDPSGRRARAYGCAEPAEVAARERVPAIGAAGANPALPTGSGNWSVRERQLARSGRRGLHQDTASPRFAEGEARRAEAGD